MRKTGYRYFMMYESDEIVCRQTEHIFGQASALKTAKGYISKCRQLKSDKNPRNFRVFDSEQDGVDGYALCVYQED